MSESKRPKIRERRLAIVVAGMHRSGTSALSGVVHSLGAALPANLLAPNDNNPHGYFESRVLCDLHDEILQQAGSHWDQVRGPARDWFETEDAACAVERLARSLREEFADTERFVLKDPRICRLLPLWKRVFARLDLEARFLIPIRHPDAVARSLERASGVPESLGRWLWLDHVLRAEHSTRGEARAFVSYRRLLDDWRGELTRADECARLGLDRPDPSLASEIDAFLQRRREPGTSGQPLHPWIEETWRELRRANEDPGIDLALLDSIRETFATAQSAFAPGLAAAQRELRRALDDARECDAQIRELGQRLAAAASGRRELQVRLAARRGEIEALRKSVELLTRWVRDRSRTPHEPAPVELRAALDAIEKAPTAEVPQIASTAALLAEKNLRIRALEDERARRARELVETGRRLARRAKTRDPSPSVDRWRAPSVDRGRRGVASGCEMIRHDGGRAVMIDACIPTPARDARSHALLATMKRLREAGFGLTFVPENLDAPDFLAKPLLASGIEVVGGRETSSVEDFLRREGAGFDLCWLGRATIADRWRDACESLCPRAAIAVIDFDEPVSSDRPPRRRSREIRVRDFGARRDVYVTTGTRDDGAADALLWLRDEIIPALREVAAPEPRATRFAVRDREWLDVVAGAANVIDRVAESEIGEAAALDRYRVAIAPARFGSDLSGPVGIALSRGLPCIVTSQVAARLPAAGHPAIAVADRADDFARAIDRWVRDGALWRAASNAALTHPAALRFEALAERNVAQALACIPHRVS